MSPDSIGDLRASKLNFDARQIQVTGPDAVRGALEQLLKRDVPPADALAALPVGRYDKPTAEVITKV